MGQKKETFSCPTYKVQLIGYLGKNPEHKTTKKTGRTFAILSLATLSAWKDANEEWQRKVEWHRLIVIWNQVATQARTIESGFPCCGRKEVSDDGKLCLLNKRSVLRLKRVTRGALSRLDPLGAARCSIDSFMRNAFC
jgi:hypothetical protein